MPSNPYPAGVMELLERLEHSRISSMRSVVAGIVRIINDPRCGARDLREVIEIDPPLAARVLKLANSAYYGTRVKIMDIMQAIIFVGFAAIKELALSQEIGEVLRHRNPGEEPLELWRHCVAVALTSKLIYRREFRQSGDNAYAAGLLHDIGTIVLKEFASEACAEVERILAEGQRDIVTVETEIFGFDHALLGQAITEAWNFPSEFNDAIGGHHRPERTAGEPSRLTLTLLVADGIARRQGFGDGRTCEPDTVRFNDSLQRLDLTVQALELIFRDVQIEIREMQKKGLLS